MIDIWWEEEAGGSELQGHPWLGQSGSARGGEGGSRETDQWLLDAPLEDPSSVLSTKISGSQLPLTL